MGGSAANIASWWSDRAIYNKEVLSMITILKQQCVGESGGYIEAIGLSTDTKPSKIGALYVTNGSAVLEMDTGDLYLYDEAGQTWIKQ
jgi:hypothetical protein